MPARRLSRTGLARGVWVQETCRGDSVIGRERKSSLLSGSHGAAMQRRAATVGKRLRQVFGWLQTEQL